MDGLGRAGLTALALLWTAVASAQPQQAHLVYTSDLRGTVGICG